MRLQCTSCCLCQSFAPCSLQLQSASPCLPNAPNFCNMQHAVAECLLVLPECFQHACTENHSLPASSTSTPLWEGCCSTAACPYLTGWHLNMQRAVAWHPISLCASTSIYVGTQHHCPLNVQGVFAPPGGKRLVAFIDDLNMPQKSKFGFIPPLELLKLWVDYGFW